MCFKQGGYKVGISKMNMGLVQGGWNLYPYPYSYLYVFTNTRFIPII